MDGFNNKHYIAIDKESRIIDGWSDGPHPDWDIDFLAAMQGVNL